VDVSIVGVSDLDGDPVTITISAITQDEPVDRGGGGNPCPDAAGVVGGIAGIRAERRGSGDGRVYHVAFVADDGRGGQCDGTATVCVPISQKPGGACVDQGSLFDSLTEACASPCDDLCTVEMAVSSVCSAEQLPQALSRRLDSSRRLLARAAKTTSDRKASRLVARVMKSLQQAARIGAHVETSGLISPARELALESMVHEAQALMAR